MGAAIFSNPYTASSWNQKPIPLPSLFVIKKVSWSQPRFFGVSPFSRLQVFTGNFIF